MRYLLASVCLGALFLTGCSGTRQQLKVGVIDTSRVLTQLPEYQNMRLTVSREASEIFLDTRVTEEPSTEAEWELLRADAQARRQKLNQKVRDFLEVAVEDMRLYSEEVAREKDIDLVIADNPFRNATVQYCDGEDITTDVLLRMETK